MTELVAVGRTYREVAAEVFGDARYRGRVERIVRREPAERRRLRLAELLESAEACESGAAGEGEEQPWLPQLLPLFGAMLKRRLEAGQPVSGRDLIALADLEQRLENQKSVDRLNDITRGYA